MNLFMTNLKEIHSVINSFKSRKTEYKLQAIQHEKCYGFLDLIIVFICGNAFIVKSFICVLSQ